MCRLCCIQVCARVRHRRNGVPRAETPLLEETPAPACALCTRGDAAVIMVRARVAVPPRWCIIDTHANVLELYSY